MGSRQEASFFKIRDLSRIGALGRALLHLLKKTCVRAAKIVILRYIDHPERIISVVFRELSPVSNQLVEAALCCAFNASKPTPGKIVGNYCQGAVLFGVHNTDVLEWKVYPERAIITKETAHLTRTVKRFLRQDRFQLRLNCRFDEVVNKCKREHGTWITDPLVDLYRELFRKGFAWSIEACLEEELVGGMWGIKIGGVYGVMSIFHSVNQAGSVAMGFMVEKVIKGEISVLDWGVLKPQFARYGAEAISRERFVEEVTSHINDAGLLNSCG